MVRRLLLFNLELGPICELLVVNQDSILHARELLDDWKQIPALQFWVEQLQNVVQLRMGHITIVILVYFLDYPADFSQFVVVVKNVDEFWPSDRGDLFHLLSVERSLAQVSIDILGVIHAFGICHIDLAVHFFEHDAEFLIINLSYIQLGRIGSLASLFAWKCIKQVLLILERL